MREENIEAKELIAEVCDLQKKLAELDSKQKEELAYVIQLYIMGETEIPNEKRIYH
ncbi:MAG: hypothetical protein K0R78_681 [Pelosinus sp.]|jgi:hypothetical protein|nr:hypothetical protein [Pelosinus sp.]